MESHRRGLDLSFLDIDLVAAQYNWDILANPLEIPMPVRNVLVGDSGGDIKHDDTALPLNIIPVSEATKFLLSSRIPHVEH